MKKVLVIAVLIFPVFLNAQHRGISFVQNIGWEDILKRAKEQNKYIFVDCYTTWCGPCKMMERNVYMNDSVGELVNIKFISVKIQMDTTNRDNETIKKWYSTSHMIAAKFKINAYPSYLFFSPEGQIMHKDVGALNVRDFLAMTDNAMDSLRQYYTLLRKCTNGDKDYSLFPYLINTAKRLREDSVGPNLAEDYVQSYLDVLPERDLFTKENLTFIASNLDAVNSKDRLFKVYYADGLRVDSLLGASGFSNRIVNHVIYKEEIISRINASKIDASEPDWSAIAKTITREYGSGYVENNIIQAKVDFYRSTKKWEQYTKYFVQQIELVDFQKIKPGYWSVMMLNNDACEIFDHSMNKIELEKALDWVNKAISLSDKPLAGVIDTKANLLYKLNRKSEAISLEEKAVALSPNDKTFRDMLEKMRAGLPTWSSN